MKVAIFGAGTMGSGIAQVFAAKGHTALMYASSVASAQKHKDKLAASLAKRVAKGKMTQEAVDALLANILVEEKSACADADLIIECVKEDMATKKELLCELDELCKPEAIFASNTSSLSITEMGNGLKHPVIGMHFFNPVPSMKLVEIINAYDTSADTIETGKAIAKGFGKEFVTVTDVPMFIANRVMCPMMNEAAILAGENVCSYEDIDKACELGYNLPMGPLKLADAIGIDIMISVMESLYQETADSKYRPAHLYKVLYRAGRLGRKSGKGFYDYTK